LPSRSTEVFFWLNPALKQLQASGSGADGHEIETIMKLAS
jgi:hypothetical protein